MIARLKEIQPIDRKLAEVAFSSNNPKNICDALVRVAYHDDDYQWVQNKCITFLHSDDLDVRRLAVACLGHLARIHNKLDKKLVIPLLEEMRKDKEIEGVVEDALDDINMFVE